MTLYQKWLLAFAVVILIAVGTIAGLVGQRTADEFRRYAMQYGGQGSRLAVALAEYYARADSWDALPVELGALLAQTLPGGGAQRGRGWNSGAAWDVRVTDSEGRVVADSLNGPLGQMEPSTFTQGLPVTLDDDVVGYVLFGPQNAGAALEEPAQEFLTQVQGALLLGAAVAFVAALVVGAILVRGIVSPLRALNRAAQTVAAGDLGARAPVRGRDEVAQLARTFNHMTESLAQAEAARRAQTSDIAHELRNPLAVLQGTLEAIADGVYAPTPENIDPALDQVRTLNRLVEDLRLLAQADAGELSLERGPLDLGGFLARAAEAYRTRFDEHGVGLALDLPAALPLIDADADRLAQVLGNVLENALRYLPAGRAVRIAASPEPGGVVVRLSDNGPGVPPEALPRLFERFWRGERSRSRTTGGSGLGLAIARRIIEAHGGRIWAEPTPGGGLTIVFWLPG